MANTASIDEWDIGIPIRSQCLLLLVNRLLL